MSFTTGIFIAFMAGVCFVHYLLPGGRWQNLFLLLASMAFYMWGAPRYGILIAATVGVSYGFALLIERLGGRGRKLALALGIVLLLSELFVFKYYDFFLTAIMDITGLDLSGNLLGLALPVGISFYTFSTVGYLIDVGRGATAAEKNFIDYALFVSFLPAVLSGPIGRAGELLPQFKSRRDFRYGNLRVGLQRFLTGAFRKVVLADGLLIVVGDVFADPAAYGGLTVALSVLFYSLIVYLDFSGYSDMAVGAGRMLGIELRENFRAPFFARDMGDFWKRWHMSLTSWLTDYIFTPLVWSRWGNRLLYGRRWEEKKPVVLINIVIVFLVSGIWHGAGYGYMVWGLAHGLMRLLEERVPGLKSRRGDGRVKKALGAARVYLFH